MTKVVDRIIYVLAVVLAVSTLVACDVRVTCDNPYVECAHPLPQSGTLDSLGVAAYYYRDREDSNVDTPIGIEGALNDGYYQ